MRPPSSKSASSHNQSFHQVFTYSWTINFSVTASRVCVDNIPSGNLSLLVCLATVNWVSIANERALILKLLPIWILFLTITLLINCSHWNHVFSFAIAIIDKLLYSILLQIIDIFKLKNEFPWLSVYDINKHYWPFFN